MPRHRAAILDQPVTLAQIEAGLDRLARIMVIMGDDGRKLLPIFDRLEREAAGMRAADQAMDKVRERARRAMAATAALP